MICPNCNKEIKYIVEKRIAIINFHLYENGHYFDPPEDLDNIGANNTSLDCQQCPECNEELIVVRTTCEFIFKLEKI